MQSSRVSANLTVCGSGDVVEINYALKFKHPFAYNAGRYGSSPTLTERVEQREKLRKTTSSAKRLTRTIEAERLVKIPVKSILKQACGTR